jgi:hypothetical protein
MLLTIKCAMLQYSILTVQQNTICWRWEDPTGKIPLGTFHWEHPNGNIPWHGKRGRQALSDRCGTHVLRLTPDTIDCATRQNDCATRQNKSNTTTINLNLLSGCSIHSVASDARGIQCWLNQQHSLDLQSKHIQAVSHQPAMHVAHQHNSTL